MSTSGSASPVSSTTAPSGTPRRARCSTSSSEVGTSTGRTDPVCSRDRSSRFSSSASSRSAESAALSSSASRSSRGEIELRVAQGRDARLDPCERRPQVVRHGGEQRRAHRVATPAAARRPRLGPPAGRARAPPRPGRRRRRACAGPTPAAAAPTGPARAPGRHRPRRPRVSIAVGGVAPETSTTARDLPAFGPSSRTGRRRSSRTSRTPGRAARGPRPRGAALPPTARRARWPRRDAGPPPAPGPRCGRRWTRRPRRRPGTRTSANAFSGSEMVSSPYGGVKYQLASSPATSGRADRRREAADQRRGDDAEQVSEQHGRQARARRGRAAAASVRRDRE